MGIKNKEKMITFDQVKKMCDEEGISFQDFLESIRNNEIKTFVERKDGSIAHVHITDICDDTESIKGIFTD